MRHDIAVKQAGPAIDVAGGGGERLIDGVLVGVHDAPTRLLFADASAWSSGRTNFWRQVRQPQ